MTLKYDTLPMQAKELIHDYAWAMQYFCNNDITNGVESPYLGQNSFMDNLSKRTLNILKRAGYHYDMLPPNQPINTPVEVQETVLVKPIWEAY